MKRCIFSDICLHRFFLRDIEHVFRVLPIEFNPSGKLLLFEIQFLFLASAFTGIGILRDLFRRGAE